MAQLTRQSLMGVAMRLYGNFAGKVMVPVTETLRRAPAAEAGTLRRETEAAGSLGRASASAADSLYRP